METQTISISLEPSLVPKMDARAQALDLNRSQYVRRLVRADILTARPATFVPRRPRKPKTT